MNLLDDADSFSLRQFETPDGRKYHLMHRTGTDDFYMRQDELVQGNASSIRQPPEHLWEQYLERGGEDFRDGLFATHGCEGVMFTDIRSYVWIKFEWGMDFCNLYNPKLKETILTYYRHHKMGLRGPGIVTEREAPALSDHLSRQLAQLATWTHDFCSQVSIDLGQVRGEMGVFNYRVTQVEVTQQKDREENHAFHKEAARHIAANDRKVECLTQDVQKLNRVYTLYERTIRGFSENVCGYTPSVEQTRSWGKELSKRYGSQMPGGRFPQTPCPFYGGKLVNYYEPWMLIDYFTELGLYKPQARGAP